MTHDPADRDDDPRLPEALQRDLRAAFAPRRDVPRRVDAAVRTAAARTLRGGRVLAMPVRLGVAAAALAVIGLAVQLAVRSLGGDPATSETVALAREDFDGDGTVDVLDAYRLALRVQRGLEVEAWFDLDGDGRVDERDAAVIARRAVRIGAPR